MWTKGRLEKKWEGMVVWLALVRFINIAGRHTRACCICQSYQITSPRRPAYHQLWWRLGDTHENNSFDHCAVHISYRPSGVRQHNGRLRVQQGVRPIVLRGRRYEGMVIFGDACISGTGWCLSRAVWNTQEPMIKVDSWFWTTVRTELFIPVGLFLESTSVTIPPVGRQLRMFQSLQRCA
jgi:hypothetical protein